MGRIKSRLHQPPPDKSVSQPIRGSRAWQAYLVGGLKKLSLHHLLACLALLIGGGFAVLSMLEEAALCALFLLACLHQAHVLAADRERHRTDELLLIILRQLDEVRARKP